MKKLVSVVAFLWLQALYAQANIVGVEYFIDADPGPGQATTVSVDSGPDITADFTVGLAAVADGLHTLFVRVQDADGDWSLAMARPFLKQSLTALDAGSEVVAVEYFIDADPGLGQATSASVDPSGDITADVAVDLSAVEDGLHTLFVRVQDANGIWSLAMARPFLKQSLTALDAGPEVVAVEYFIDADPGPGQATSASIDPNGDVTADISVGLGAVEDGLHTLFVRVQDANDVWSLAMSQPFLRQSRTALNPAPNIAAIDYYFVRNADNVRTQISTYADFEPAADLEADFALNLAGLSGNYTAFVAARDELGISSLAVAHQLSVEFEPSPPVALADSATTEADSSVVIAVLANDFDPDGTALLIASLTQPDNGAATIEGDTSVVYAPAAGFTGEDAFTYTVVDADGASATGAVVVQVDTASTEDPTEDPIVDLPETQEGNGTAFLDFDLASGDQGVRQLTGVRPGQEIKAQVVLGQTFTDFKQILVIITFDPAQMTPIINQPVGIFSNAFALQPLASGNEASFGGPLFIGGPLTGAGEVLEVGFETTADFAGPVVLELVEMSIGPSSEELQVLNPGATVVVAGAGAIDGDMNGDGQVDFDDFALFETFFGTTEASADFDASGLVDFRDFFILASNFDPAALGKLVALARQRLGLPSTPHLEQNYPNPFNSDTVIGFVLPQRSAVELAIYNLTGQRVATLLRGVRDAGLHTARWDGRDEGGHQAATGIYFYRLQAGDYAEVRKLSLLR